MENAGQKYRQIETLVKDILERQVRANLIVHVKEDTDSDGDEILKINVIFEGASQDLDVEKLTAAMRDLRQKLRHTINGEIAFPLFSFISKADYKARASR